MARARRPAGDTRPMPDTPPARAGGERRLYDQAQEGAARRTAGAAASAAHPFYDQAQEGAARRTAGAPASAARPFYDQAQEGAARRTAGAAASAARPFYDQAQEGAARRASSAPAARAGQGMQQVVLPPLAPPGPPDKPSDKPPAKQPAKPPKKQPPRPARGAKRRRKKARGAPAPAAQPAAAPQPEDAALPPLRSRGSARRQRARRRRAALYSVLVLAAVGIWLLVAFAFKIGNITVEGDSVYSEALIIETFGHRIGDNLFSFGVARAQQQLCDALPYLETVHISRVLPDTVRIRVSPSVETYSFERADGQSVITSAACKVLRIGNNTGGLLSVAGLALDEPVPGQALGVPDAEQAAALQAVLQALQAAPLHGVSQVELGDVYDITLRCEGRFVVKLGTTVGLEYKLQLAAETIYNQLEPDATGVVDVSSAPTGHAAYYTPMPLE